MKQDKTVDREEEKKVIDGEEEEKVIDEEEEEKIEYESHHRLQCRTDLLNVLRDCGALP